jgi:uncharacterized protein with GYD domain
MAEGQFILLVKTLDSTGAPAVKGAAPDASAVENFAQALTNVEETTGVKATESFVAQGAYDYIVIITVDTTAFPPAPGVDPASVTAQHVALGFAGALSKIAGVTTESVPVVDLTDPTFVGVFHSCTVPAG